jgi:hypothetical protein
VTSQSISLSIMSQTDVTKINNNDFTYCTKLYKDYLGSYTETKPTGPVKYYYQYEYDSSTTYYESLMRQHLITIRAESYEEAMLCNVILRCLLDGHFGGMLNYCAHDAQWKYLNEPIDQYFETIKKSQNMSQYNDYCQENPVPLKNGPGTYTIHNFHKFEIECQIENIFTMEILLELLHDPKLRKVFKDEEKRIPYVLSMGV